MRACLHLIVQRQNKFALSGEELVVTSNGQPVLKVIPYHREMTIDEAFADVRGKIVYHGNLLEPTTDEWWTT